MRRTLGIIGVLAAWQLLSILMHSAFIPGLQAVAVRAYELRGELVGDVLSSLGVVLAGYGTAAVSGFIVGIITARFTLSEQVLAPVIDLIRPVPALALFPLFIVLLGLGIRSKAVVIFWTAWPAVTLNTFQALRQVDKEIVGAARLDGAGELSLLARIMIPVGAQTIFTGLRLAMSGAWISVVAAEMLGANSGLGFFVMMQSNSFDFPAMYAGIILIALVGLGLNRAIVAVQKAVDWGGVYAEVSDRGRHRARRSALDLGAAEDQVRGLQGLRPGVRGDRQRVLRAERD